MGTFKSLVIVFLSIYFVVSRCTENEDVSKINKRYIPEEGPHIFKGYDYCSSAFHKKFHKTLMRSTCMPRETTVELIAPSPEILLVPSKIMARRCSGECHAKQSCLATNSTVTPFEIQQLNIIENTQKCGVVYVEEHTRCSCKCTVMKEHCSPKQDYKPGECMCLCMNDKERKICNDTPGRFWDSDKCTCLCHEKKVCSTGLIWVPEHCSCAKLMNVEENEIDIVYQD